MIYIYAVLVLAAVCTAKPARNLGDESWQIVNSNGSVRCVGSVPGGIHTDLQECGKIGYPDFGYNDKLQRWVAEERWSYSTHFNATSEDGAASFL